MGSEEHNYGVDVKLRVLQDRDAFLVFWSDSGMTLNELRKLMVEVKRGDFEKMYDYEIRF